MMSLPNRTRVVESGFRRPSWIAACAVALLVPLSARPGPGRQAVAPAATIALAPCEIPGVKDKARCGTYRVWENRQAKSGRRIGLKVVVLPATGATREKDALTFLAGGMLAYSASFAVDVTFLLPFAAGNFIYIAAADLIPEIKHHDEPWGQVIHFLSFLSGLGLLWAVGFVFEH